MTVQLSKLGKKNINTQFIYGYLSTVAIFFNGKCHSYVYSRFKGYLQCSFSFRDSCAIRVKLNVLHCCCKSCTGGAERQRTSALIQGLVCCATRS